jgi:hypothetical protein
MDKLYHKTKSAESYQRNKINPDWLKSRQEYSSSRRRFKKSEAVQRFGGLCSNCGGEYPDAVFEFHHMKDEEKDITPAKLFLLKDETINNELDKCVMLCANCHRVEHIRLEYKAHNKRYD